MLAVLSLIFLWEGFMKKKIKIMPGCIGCGLCQALAPHIFTVTDISRVREDVDYETHSCAIQEAAASCPVGVIVYEDDKDISDKG